MQSGTTTAITAVKQDVRLREWAEQLEAQLASGLTVRPAMVCRKRHQDQELLLSASQSPGTVYLICTDSRSVDCTTAAECRYPD